MSDLYTNAFSDNFRMAKSKFLYELATGSYNIIRIPKHAFVTDVWALVSTAYDNASAVVTVGWQGNGETAVADGFMSSAIFDGAVVGLKRAQHDTLESFEGKYFSGGSGAITVTIDTGTASTLAQFYVLAMYSVIY